MSVVISVANQKGGVGKTVTVSSVAAILKSQGYKVLVLNLDPQRNLDMVAGRGMAIPRADTETLSLLHVLRGECALRDAIVPSAIGDLVRASSLMTQWTGRHLATREEFRTMEPEALRSLMQERYTAGYGANDANVLNEELCKIKDEYDYVLMDTNPSLTLLTLNSLFAADYVLIPAFAEAASMDAVIELQDTIKTVLTYNPGKYLKIAGILITKYRAITNIAKSYTDAYEKVAGKLGTIVFKQKIRDGIVVSEYVSAQQNLLEYDKGSKVTKDYIAFAEELKQRISELEAIRRG